MSQVQSRLDRRTVMKGVRVRPVPRDSGFPIGSYDYATEAEYNYLSSEYSCLRDYAFASSEGYYYIHDSGQEVLDKILRTRMLGRVKLSKALTRINRDFSINNLILKDFGTDQFHVSTRYSDILRCAETPHFGSCFSASGCYSIIPAMYLRNPGIAIAFIRNRAGHFKSRVFLYMLEDGNIALGRFYGDTCLIDAIKNTFPNWVKAASGYDCDWAKLKYPMAREISYSDFGVKDEMSTTSGWGNWWTHIKIAPQKSGGYPYE